MNSITGVSEHSRPIRVVVLDDRFDLQYIRTESAEHIDADLTGPILVKLSGQPAISRSDLAKLRDCVLFVSVDCVLIATASSTHGVYWSWRGCELILSPVEARVAGSLESLPPKLDELSVARFIHDDANLTPMASLFAGVSRLPGGCVASFRQPGRGPVVQSLLASLENVASEKSRAVRLASAIDGVAKRLVAEAGEKTIYMPISGGIDGTVLLAALAKHGARITAVYGDDGLLQHRINRRLLSDIRREFPRAEITYQFVNPDRVNGSAIMDFQKTRLRWNVKGNYLKEGYKLALADFFVADSTSDFACAVNGYCIDESYMGGKGPAAASSIYPPSLPKTLEYVRATGAISRLGLEWHWATWRIRSAFGEGDETQARRLARRLSRTGKSGGVIAPRRDLSRTNFERAVARDADEVADLLVASIGRIRDREALTRFIKLFSYYFVEQNHILRFFEHGRAMGVPYFLPYADVDIRNELIDYVPRWCEFVRPKRMLFAYLRNQCNVDYERIIREAQRRLPSPRAGIVAAARAFVGRRVRIAFRLKQRNARPQVFLHTRRALMPMAEWSCALLALSRTSSASYFYVLHSDLRLGRTSQSYSSKELYNSAHLLIYLAQVIKHARH